MRHPLAPAVNRVDGRRSRTRQRLLGPSDVGTCRRRAGYRLHRTPETDAADHVAATLGTWLHAGLLKALAVEYGAVTEVRLQAPHLRGRADAVYPWDSIVEDVKTRGDSFPYVVRDGPRTSERWQVTLYAWLLRMGYVVDKRDVAMHPEVLRLRYVKRSDGHEHVVEWDYDDDDATDALAWLEEVVVSKAPEVLPRDQAGPGLSFICDSCPWLRQCWGADATPGRTGPQRLELRDDDDVAAALAQYAEGRTLAKQGDDLKKRARARLTGVEEGVYGGLALRWTGGRSRRVVDVERSAGLLQALDLPVPLREPEVDEERLLQVLSEQGLQPVHAERPGGAPSIDVSAA